MATYRQATMQVDGVTIPRLAFGLGSLMAWAPGHTHPLPTDSSKEVQQALDAGMRHINTSDIYTNNVSAAQALRAAAVPRKDIFFSLKLNTFAKLGCTGEQSMVESCKREIDRYGLEGYVDLLQLHFPPRGLPGNMTNRQAWKVLEQLKEQKVARLIGVSNWSLKDYEDLYQAGDIVHHPRVNEYELNPFLLHDPAFQKLRAYEQDRGIINMNYGFLTVFTGKLATGNAKNLLQYLEEQSKDTEYSPSEMLLSWAYDGPSAVVVSSTSSKQRVERMAALFLSKSTEPLDQEIIAGIERAAEKDGYLDKVVYKHAHMNG